MVLAGTFGEPHLRRIDKWLVNATVFRQSNDSKALGLGLRLGEPAKQECRQREKEDWQQNSGT
jgi:hypothetical protein